MSIFSKLTKALFSKRYLVVTNIAAGIASITLGDSIQQYIEYSFFQESRPEITDKSVARPEFHLDLHRLKNMAYVGVYFGVCGHVWYTFLDKRFPPKMRKAVLKKILAEAIVGPFYVSTIFFLMGKLQHHTATQSWQNLQNNLVALFAAEYLIFMPIQWLNFTYVPVKQRYMYVAIVSVIYDVFLSFILHRNEDYRKRYKAEKAD